MELDAMLWLTLVIATSGRDVRDTRFANVADGDVLHFRFATWISVRSCPRKRASR
jgi:hypothetical protein